MRALYTAATGMRAFQTKIDNIANNLSNANTTGYKKVRESFEDLVYQKVGFQGGEEGASTPNPMQVGAGVRLQGLVRDMSMGAVTVTNNSSDMVIDGPGFFVVETPSGEERFTRDGHLRVDSEGNLVTQGGDRLAPGITVPNGYLVVVGSDGNVTATAPDASETVTLGTIELAMFANPGGLEATGSNLYRATEASGEAQRTTPGEDGAGSIVQGALEGSNVDVAEELVGMITAQRSYELSSKVIQAADEMMQTTVNLRR